MKAILSYYVLPLTLYLNSVVAASQFTRSNITETAAITNNIETSQSIAQYKESILEYESRYGVYDHRLGEQLLGLGLLYKESGQYEKAHEVLKRALLINNVNHSPDNTKQIPILREQIALNIATQNWEQLDQNYNRLLLIYSRKKDPDDPTTITIMKIIADWKLEAFHHKLLTRPYTSFSEAAETYRLIVEQIEST